MRYTYFDFSVEIAKMDTNNGEKPSEGGYRATIVLWL